MNPENRDFPNFEEEIASKAENKEKKEQINLSFASAADLVKQIKANKGLNLNEYQRTCQFAVIHNKITNEYDFWDLAAKDGISNFREELLTYYEEAGDKNMKVFFCDSDYDIPLFTVPTDFSSQIEPDETLRYITPDGIKFQRKSYHVDGENRTVLEFSYSDEERLSVNEVKKLGESVKNEFGEKSSNHFLKFDYDFEEDTKHNQILDQE